MLSLLPDELLVLSRSLDSLLFDCELWLGLDVLEKLLAATLDSLDELTLL